MSLLVAVGIVYDAAYSYYVGPGLASYLFLNCCGRIRV